MKKKLFTLLTLMVLCVTGVWGASYIPTTVKTISTTANYVVNDIQSENWVNIPSKTISDITNVPTNTTFGTTSGTKYKGLKVKTDGNVYNSQKRCIHMLVTGITGVEAIGSDISDRGLQIGATEYTDGMSEKTSMNIVAGNTSAQNPVSYSGLSAKKTYIITILAYSSDTYVYAVRFTAGATDLDDPGLSVSPTSSTLVVDGTQQISASATSGGTITYQSSNDHVVTVSNTGLIEAVGVGNAIITTTVAATGTYDTDSKQTTVIVKSVEPTLTYTSKLDTEAHVNDQSYFTVTSGEYNNKFEGSYGGTDYSAGLKLTNSTSISFTNASACDLVVVQSLWSDYVIKFDGTNFASDYSTKYYYDDATNKVRVYTIKNIDPGDHTITRTSEVGLFYIGVTDPLIPSISADNVNISEEAKNDGEIAFTVNHPVDGGVVTAAKSGEANWLTLGAVDNTNGKVPFTATANTESSSRTATVTLTYTYNTNETVTKDVTITQAADVAGTAIIKATLTGTNTAEISGTIGGSYDVNVYAPDANQGGGCKFGVAGKYVGITLSSGSFKTGDIINVHTTTTAHQGTIAIYDTDKSTILYNTGVYTTSGTAGEIEDIDNKFTLPAAVNGKSTIYICRTNDNNWNGYVDFIEVTRPNAVITLNAAGYATYSAASDFEVYSGAKAYQAVLNTTDNKITCSEIEGKIPAGAGVLLYGDANAIVTLFNTTGATALEDNDLKGTTTASGSLATMEGSKYYYALNGDTFKHYTGSAFVAGKAYFESDTELNSKAFAIVFESETTGINGVEEVAPKTTKTRKVVKNGRLVIETANGEFTIDGTRVK